MKRRLICFALSALLVLSICGTLFTSAATYSLVKTEKSGTIDTASYQMYTITSGENGNFVSAAALTFSPEDYIPVAFSCYSGTSAVLSKQYEMAVDKYGYDVLGVINGSFFSMDSEGYGAYGTLVGNLISDGKIASAHVGSSNDMVAFMSDGSMQVVNSNPSYEVSINGQVLPNSLYYINKTSGSKRAPASWSSNFYYYDTSCGRVCDTYEICPGYEVLCKKLDNTDLSIGGTLLGEVISVTENAYGGALAETYSDLSDKFILFCKTDSSRAAYVKDLKAGDSINITATENGSGKGVMEKANSALVNVGWLVKDGVDRTRIDSTIGTHSVTLEARWTAFGTKPDGTYVFFTTEGASTGSKGSVTLRDVAKAMIELGCTNVIRMDGGGSSAMYVKDAGDGNPGYLQSSTRAVGDCILVVKRSSMQGGAMKEKLTTLKNAKKDEVAKAYTDIVAEAEELLATDTAVEADFRRVYQNLASVDTTFSGLREAIEDAKAADSDEYAPSAYAKLVAAKEAAEGILTDKDSKLEDAKAALSALSVALAATGSYKNNVALGCSYTYDKSKPGTGYPDTDNKELTDGKHGEPSSASDSSWIGISSTSIEWTVDLGEVKSGLTEFNIDHLNLASWGITIPSGITASVSNDGTNYTVIGDLTCPGASSAVDKVYDYTLVLDEPVEARYVHIKYKNSGWMFFGEFEVISVEDSPAIAKLRHSVTVEAEGDGTVQASKKSGFAGDEITLTATPGANAEFLEFEVVQGDVTITDGKFVIGSEDVVIKAKFKSSFIRGDVDGNGKVESKDYIKLKRFVLNTYKTDDPIELQRMNVDQKGGIDSKDYVMLKRVVLGTYSFDK